jgi:uncharacterized RDD family membrane protein YckC
MNEQKEPLGVAETAQKEGDGIEVRESTTPRTPVSIDELVITPLAEPPMRRYAGFWVWVWAYVIDGFVLAVVQVLGDLFIANLIWSIVGFFYFIFMTFRFNQTLGKMALGIEVVRVDGQPNQLGNLFLREFIGKILSGVILMLGYIIVAFDPKKMSFHDRIASTYVVYKGT